MELSKLIKKQDEEFDEEFTNSNKTYHIGWGIGDNDRIVFLKFIDKVRRETAEYERERILKMLPKEKIAQPEENWDGKSGTFGAFNDCLKQVKKILKQ